ncbi:3-hydroxybutyryl-CoA dehydrogenase [Micromonospora sp. FIMYZ51]|uniref:3-hydroxybutyryl-CoA dehydrogenase n=1 Tax=Micromonospora sp. FIMYZ51 TaxID=3051832 RepID=UPI00311DF48F
MSDFTRIGVVGGGTMGAGFAELCIVNGLDVVVAAPTADSVARSQRRLFGSLARQVEKGKLSAQARDLALTRLRFTTDLGDLADRQFVLESVPENEQKKLDVFAALDKVVESPEAILASNTSSIPIARLGRATARADRVIGIHFFNPVQVLPLVELIGSLRTDEKAYLAAEAFVGGTLGKQVIRSPDRPGFVVNALLIPYLLSAVRMLESGVATAADIDTAMTRGCAHPMGPLALVDLIGLDTVAAVADALYIETKEHSYAVPPLLARMVDSGFLGKKSGRGFYSYDKRP